MLRAIDYLLVLAGAIPAAAIRVLVRCEGQTFGSGQDIEEVLSESGDHEILLTSPDLDHDWLVGLCCQGNLKLFWVLLLLMWGCLWDVWKRRVPLSVNNTMVLRGHRC